jgi:hypothetical protein
MTVIITSFACKGLAWSCQDAGIILLDNLTSFSGHLIVPHQVHPQDMTGKPPVMFHTLFVLQNKLIGSGWHDIVFNVMLVIPLPCSSCCGGNWYLLVTCLSYPEDGGTTFPWNVGNDLPDYMVTHSRSHHCENLKSCEDWCAAAISWQCQICHICRNFQFHVTDSGMVIFRFNWPFHSSGHPFQPVVSQYVCWW